MNKPDWIKQENQEFRLATEKRFAEYYKKRKAIWDSISDSDKMMVSNQIRSRSITEGMMMEAITINDWLDRILKLQ